MRRWSQVPHIHTVLAPLNGLGHRLREARQELRLTTKELAAKVRAKGVDTSDASVSRYEGGKRIPGVDYVEAVAELAGYTLAYVIRGDEPRLARDMPSGEEAAPEVIVQLKAFVRELERRYGPVSPPAEDDVQQALLEALRRHEELLEQRVRPAPPTRAARSAAG